MAVNPVNISRISQNLRVSSVMSSLRQNQLDLFRTQSQIASGRSFVTPSEDPVGAARVLDLTQVLGRQEQFVQNLTHADNVLAAADGAITEINTLLIDAQSIASSNVSNLTSASERSAEAELVRGILDQLLVVGNRQFSGRFIFAGRDTTNMPFVDGFGGVEYRGDTGELFTRVSDDFSAATNVPGNVLFGALSAQIATNADLTPALTASIRLDDIVGARGQEIGVGTLVFNEVGGAGTFQVDLARADSIGDVVDLINRAASDAGASVTASLAADGIVITPGSADVSVSDTSAGAIADNLGILTATPTRSPINGAPLTPRLSRLTPVADLARGAAIDLAGGLVISNGTATATIDLSAAETVQEIINLFNNSGVGIVARVNDAGTGIDVFNQVSGTNLSIGENGGTTAADLGLRTMDTATPLDALNFGRGFETRPAEDDLRIVARSGASVDVNLDDAGTVGDVIDLINAAATDAGVSITVSFSAVGNGIRIVDGTGGSGALSVQALNASTAAIDLGLAGATTPDSDELTGTDANPTRTEGVIGALIDLQRALISDDTQGISLAAERIDTFAPEVTRVHGRIGAQSAAMRDRLAQTQNAAQTTEIFLSEIRDLDFAEAATKMQSSITQLQASYQTSSILLNLSLMDFLR